MQVNGVEFPGLEAAMRFPAACLLLVPASMAATLVVPDDYPCIQEAISTSADGDTVLVMQGIYDENIDFLDRNIVLTSDDWSDSGVIISGGGSGSVVTIAGGQDSTARIEGFTIINGTGTGGVGGGVMCVDTSPSIVSNFIHSNHVWSGSTVKGGGIYAHGGSPVIHDNHLHSNSISSSGVYSTRWGGGIFLSACSNVSVEGNIIEDNFANSAALGSCGGGIYLEGCTGEVTGNTFTGNGAAFGGGLYLGAGCEILVASNLFEGNWAAYGTVSLGSQTGCMIELNVISQNICNSEGGGIYVHSASGHSISNNLIRNNQGGAISLYNSTTIDICNNTISDNEGVAGFSTIGVQLESSNASIRNCILWNEDIPEDPYILLESGSTLTVGYSDIGGGEAGVSVGSGSQLYWSDGNIDLDPCFDPSFPDERYLDPEAPSPCIDSGDPGPAFYDPEDPTNPGYALWPALGLLRNDMGAYGGCGAGGWVGIDDEPALPAPVTLMMASPNPCASISTLTYELPEPAYVEIRVFDLSGRTMLTLAPGSLTAGAHSASFDGSRLPSGVYLCRLQAGASIATTRIVLIR